MRTSSTPAGATLPTTSFQVVDDVSRSNPTSHITGGGASAFSTNQASSLWTLWRWCASSFRLDSSSQVHDVDIENPSGHTAATQNVPSQADLIALSEDFVKEERREIDINQKAELIAIQKKILETKNFSDMPDAVTRLIKMHGFEQAEVDRGFERGGGVYSYRNMVGSMLSFAPLLLTQIRKQPEFKNDQGFQLKMAAGYFASVLLTSCAAAAANARLLLHCTPFQDAVFDGSSRNLGFESDLLSATLKTLSTRFSDEEILAKVIVEIAVDRAIIPVGLHESGGVIVACADQSNVGQGGPFPENPNDVPAPQFGDIPNTFAEMIGIAQGDFDQLIALSNSGPNSPFPPAGSAGRAELQRLQNKLDDAMKNLGSEKILEIWGVDGLETELMGATLSKNYCRERDLCSKISLSLGFVDFSDTYNKYHNLRVRCNENGLGVLSTDQVEALEILQQRVDNLRPKVSRKNSSLKAVARLETLEKKYAEIEDDPRFIVERRFERVSDHHKKLVIDGMQVTRNEGFFNIKTEAGMLLKEGLRRGGDAPEYMATYAAGMWRAFQLGVTGVNGPLILTAAVGLCEQIYKSTLENPHAFKSQAWPKALTTAITFMALAANILAAHRVAEANVSPLSWPLKFQKLLGGTSSIAETILQVGKLVIRERFRKAERSQGEPMYGEIGVRRIASRYYLATIQAGARFKDGIAILIYGGMQAKAARKSYEARMAANNTLKDIEAKVKDLPRNTQTMVPPNAT